MSKDEMFDMSTIDAIITDGKIIGVDIPVPGTKRKIASIALEFNCGARDCETRHVIVMGLRDMFSIMVHMLENEGEAFKESLSGLSRMQIKELFKDL